MRNIFITLLLIALATISNAQVPNIQWEKYVRWPVIYQDGDQVIFDAKLTKDKGFILASLDTGRFSKSEIFNKSARSIPWLIRLDSNGNQQWNRHASSSIIDEYNAAYLAVQETADRGFVTAGYASGRYPNRDSGKVYIAKYNASGIFQWEKRYGGTRPNKAYAIQELNGVGFIVAGVTASNDGDVTGNHLTGTADVWLLRLDNAGNVRWKKCFGGTGYDTAYAVVQTPDKGFLVAGSSTSANGDVTTNAGAADAWVFKTDSLGNLEWQKTYGGLNYEAFKAISLNFDGTYTFSGYSSSASLIGNTNSGKKDMWIIRTTQQGSVLWSKLLGGTQDEESFSVQTTPEGNLLLSGYTESNDGVVSGNNGNADAWLVKLSSAGNLLWQKCIGTSNDEGSFTGLAITESDFAIAGFGRVVNTYRNDFDNYLVRLGNVNTIKGTLFEDLNGNGVKDVNEKLSKQPITINVQKTNGYLRSELTQTGQFSVAVDTGSYTVSAQIGNAYYTITPSSFTFAFSTYFNQDSVSFALQRIPNKQDLQINLLPLTPARPGFDADYRLLYKNKGTAVINNGTVILKKDSRLSFVSATPLASYNTGDSLRWNVGLLNPNDSGSISLRLKVAVPPTVNNGDSLVLWSFIEPVTGDETPADDTAYLKQRVVGSFDPNDKTEANGGLVDRSFIQRGAFLNYLIRFQNTGTDTAFTITVRDTLSNRVEASTLEMIASSHPYTLTVENGVNLTWRFNNIQLPDSNRNERASHGYIAYRIKPKTDVTVGEVVHNTASIYFDYNLPVLTNDALTRVQAPVVVLSQELLSFYGHRQGDRVRLSWQTVVNSGIKSFEIERSTDGIRFTSIGRVNSVAGRNVYGFDDNTFGLAANAFSYRLKIYKENSGAFYSRVLFFPIAQEGKESLSVSPNPVTAQSTVSLSSKKSGNAELQVVNAFGLVVNRQAVSVAAGINVYLLSRPAVPGIYYLRVVQTDGIVSTAFVLP